MIYKKIAVGLVTVLAATMPIAACTASNDADFSSSVLEPADEATIELAENSIFPDHVIIRDGATVIFENDRTSAEDIHSKGKPKFEDIHAIAPDEEVAVVFTEPGVYEFYCGDDDSKVGKIEVVEDDSLSSEIGEYSSGLDNHADVTHEDM